MGVSFMYTSTFEAGDPPFKRQTLILSHRVSEKSLDQKTGINMLKTNSSETSGFGGS